MNVIEALLAVREGMKPTEAAKPVVVAQTDQWVKQASDDAEALGLDPSDPQTVRAIAFGVALHQVFAARSGRPMPDTRAGLVALLGWTQSVVAEMCVAAGVDR